MAALSFFHTQKEGIILKKLIAFTVAALILSSTTAFAKIDAQNAAKGATKIGAAIFARAHKIPTKATHLILSEEGSKLAVKATSKVPVLKNHPRYVALSTGLGYWLIWDIGIQGQCDLWALGFDVLGSGLAVDWRRDKKYLRSEIRKAITVQYNTERNGIIEKGVSEDGTSTEETR